MFVLNFKELQHRLLLSHHIELFIALYWTSPQTLVFSLRHFYLLFWFKSTLLLSLFSTIFYLATSICFFLLLFLLLQLLLNFLLDVLTHTAEVLESIKSFLTLFYLYTSTPSEY